MSTEYHGTTILCLKKGDKTVIMADGQATMGSVVAKSNTRKLMRLDKFGVVAGMAGNASDGLILMELVEKKLNQYSGQLIRSVIELCKDWRTDKYLKHLEATIIVADKENRIMLTGNGGAMESDKPVCAIGSGGYFALSAATALMDIEGLDALEIAKRSMKIAADLCVYTNHNFVIEEIN